LRRALTFALATLSCLSQRENLTTFVDHRIVFTGCKLSTVLSWSIFHKTGQMDDCSLENLSLLNSLYGIS